MPITGVVPQDYNPGMDLKQIEWDYAYIWTDYWVTAIASDRFGYQREDNPLLFVADELGVPFFEWVDGVD